MKTTSIYWSFAVVIAFLGGVTISAQLNAARSAPNPLDAAVAASKNHKVLFEDDHIRLLEVTVQPGETEHLHNHAYPSVFAFDAPLPRFTNRLPDGLLAEFGPNWELTGSKPALPPQVVEALAELHTDFDASMPKGLPVAWARAPEDTHQIHNVDTFPVHFYRLEFKRMDGNSIKSMTKYTN